MNDIFVKKSTGIEIYNDSNDDVINITKRTPITFNNTSDAEIIIDHTGNKIATDTLEYLKINNLLSEFDTEAKKAQARKNLGMNTIIKEIETYIESNPSTTVEWDDDLDKLKITYNDNSFVSSCFEKLEPPTAPIIINTEYSISTGNAQVEIINTKAGSLLYYSLNDEDYLETSGIISLDSEFTNTNNNTDKIYTVYIKSEYNGEYSYTNYYTITIKPKCTPGTISTTKSPNNNNFATSATIILTPSTMTGINNYYSEDGGNTWKDLLETKTFTVTSSTVSELYLVKSEYSNYETTIVKSNAITLNAKKTYYGFSEKDAITSLDITLLTGGDSLERSGIESNKKYSLTLSSAGYIWICLTNTLDPLKLFHEATDLINAGFNSAIIIDGYNCYRSIEKWKSGTSSIYLKP